MLAFFFLKGFLDLDVITLIADINLMMLCRWFHWRLPLLSFLGREQMLNLLHLLDTNILHFVSEAFEVEAGSHGLFSISFLHLIEELDVSD